jgi:hypothetical protein
MVVLGFTIEPRDFPPVQELGLAQRRAELRSILILGSDTSRIKILPGIPIGIVPNRDFPTRPSTIHPSMLTFGIRTVSHLVIVAWC